MNDTKRSQGLLLALLILPFLGHTQSSDLFISEYTESPGQIEIFNNTGASVDLSNYRLVVYFGSGTSGSGTTFSLSGTINNNSAQTAGNGFSGPTPDINLSFGFFIDGGDDAIALQVDQGGGSWVTIDVVGDTGPAPWTAGTATDLDDVSIERNVCEPNTTWTPAEWTVTGEPAVTSGLGSHSCAASATTYTWNGSSWSSDPNVNAPSSIDNLVIQSGTAASISTDIEINDLTIDASATLNIDPNASITINGTATNNGTFRLNADENGYAQCIGAVGGTSVVESYLDSVSGGGNAARWFNLAFPVDATLNDVSFTNGAFIQVDNVNTSKTNIYYYDPTQLNGGTGEGTWRVVTALTDQTERIGYSAYLGAPNFGGVPTTMSVSGTLLSGQQSVSVSSANGGWNFVPNPYPSTLSWTALNGGAGNSELQDVYYIFGFDGNGATSWRSFNLFTGTNGGSNNIPPGQSFFVEVDNTTDGTILFEDSYRNVTGTTNLFKTAAAYAYIKLKAENTQTGRSDETVLGFGSDLTAAVDQVFDGTKRRNHIYPNLFTKAAGKEMTFNGMSDQFNRRSEPLFFECVEEGTYTLGISNNALPDEGWTITLEDKLTGIETDLLSSSYTFTHTPGSIEDRFEIHFNKQHISLEEKGESKIHMYVMDEVLVVNLFEPSKETSILLFDLHGRRVAQHFSESMENAMSLEHLAHGVYIVKVIQGQREVHTQKIIK